MVVRNGRLLVGKIHATTFSKGLVTDSAGAFLPRVGKFFIADFVDL